VRLLHCFAIDDCNNQYNWRLIVLHLHLPLQVGESIEVLGHRAPLVVKEAPTLARSAAACLGKSDCCIEAENEIDVIMLKMLY
jgi:hypothetical protein